MLAMLGQQQAAKGGPPPQSPAPRNDAHRFPLPPAAPSYDQKQNEYTPSAPASGPPPPDQSNSQVSALLAMLSSQQR